MSKYFKIIMGLAIGGIIAGFLVYGAIAYVAVHFLQKVW